MSRFPLPHGTSNRKAASRPPTGTWRSLELHNDHRALGLATTISTVASSAIDIAKTQPVQPVTLIRPHAAARAARYFVEKFPGRTMYAVKANPSPDLIRILWDSGVTHFDVASLAEVQARRDRPRPRRRSASCIPVKAVEAIREAYRDHGVRTFSLDSVEELDKIMRATADDEWRRCDRPNALRPVARIVGAFETQPRGKVRRGPARGEGTAVPRPSGSGRARHLLPRRQSGDDPAGIRRCDGARTRCDRRGGGDGRCRRCRRWLPQRLSRHGASLRSTGISRRSTARSNRCRSAIRRNCGPNPVVRSVPNTARSSSASKSVEATNSTSTMVPMVRLFDAAHIGWRFPVSPAA